MGHGITANELHELLYSDNTFANMVIFGRIIKLLNGLILPDTAKEALKKTIPRALDENLKAFSLGFGE